MILRHNLGVRAYVINLKSRVDRWNSVIAQSNSLGLPIVRIEAVGIDEISDRELFVAKGIAATWKSHQFAMSIFLESGDLYGLILEDDFLLTKYWDSNMLNLALQTNPDFFQLGYLVTSPQDKVGLVLNNTIDVLLKILSKLCSFSKLIDNRLGKRLLILEQKKLHWKIVPNDIRAGGQAYLISRKFALAAGYMNKPPFNSADGMFMSLGGMRSFRMFRFRRTIICQTGSMSSVQERYL